MSDMDYSVDITQDLTDGSNGGLGDTSSGANQSHGATASTEGAVPNFAQGDGSQLQAPPGTQNIFANTGTQQNNQQGQQNQAEPSIRDLLSSAFKASDGKPTTQQQAQSANTQQQQPITLSAPPQLSKDNEGKYRLADGTFASAEQVQAFEAAQKGGEQQNNQQQQSPVVTGLTPVEQQQFQSLPAELRQYVERTMEGLNTRAARYNEYDQIEQNILGPRRQALAAQGMNPIVALNSLFSMSDFAGRDPGAFVLWFAQQRNLDLDALMDQRDAQQHADPMVRQLQGQVQQLSGQLTQYQQQGVQATQSANLNDVQTFASEKDQAGAFKRPHLSDVMDSFVAQVGALRAANPNMPNPQVLEQAYQNACWLDPNVRARMQQAVSDTNRQQQQQQVAASRDAAASITGAPASTGVSVPNSGELSIRQLLEKSFAEARA